MIDSSTLTVTNGSSIDGNTASWVNPPASLSPLNLTSWLFRTSGNRRSVAKKERFRDARARKRCRGCPRVRSQNGGGAYVTSSSTLAVTDGSSIDGNTVESFVSSPASLSPLSLWLIRQGAIDTRSVRERDFALLELG